MIEKKYEMKNSKLFKILSAVLFTLIITSASAQEFLTPTTGPYGGLIRSFTYLPTGSLQSGLYASSDGGIFKYDDINDTWESRPNPGYYFTGFLADDNLDTLYLANYSSLRISGDGFDTWTEKYYDGTYNATAASIHVSPTTGTIFIGTYSHGIYRSDDNGDIWTQITTESNFSFDLTSIVINSLTESGGILIASGSGSGGVFFSMDDGLTWYQRNAGLPLSNPYVSSITTYGSYVIVGTDGFGVYYTADYGISWIPMNGITTFLGTYTIYDIEADAFGKLYAATNSGIWYTYDLGNNWYSATGITGNADIRSLIVNPDNYYVFISNYNGAFISTNYGVTFSLHNDGMTAINSEKIDASSASVFVPVNNGSLYRSDDEGNTWLDKSPDNSGSYLFAAMPGNTFIYAYQRSGALWYSPDNGDNWYLQSYPPVYPYSMEVLLYGGIPVLMIGGYNGIWVSPDNGVNWYKNYDHLPCACYEGYVYDFTQDPGTGYFYATLYGPNVNGGGGVLKSIDGGTTWSLINNTSPGSGLPNNFYANKITATISGKILVSTYGNGLWGSVDGGQSWTANPSFTNYNLNDVEATLNGKVFLSYYGNLYQSLDNGVSWEQIQWLPNTINSLTISPANNLFAATLYQSLYKSQNPLNQNFVQDITGLISSSNLPLKNASISWGDFDNDGDLDFCTAGTDAGNNDVFNVYNNDIGNLYIDISQTLIPALRLTTARWFDFNNDGFLDLMATGNNNSTGQNVTTLYKNNNGSLSEISAGFAGLALSTFDFGDLNRDGWNDIILAGRDPVTLEAKTIIYYNNWDETFTGSPNEIIGLHSGTVSLVDYNNDGYLDIFLTGTDGSVLKSLFYRYDPETSIFKIQSGLQVPGLINASADWGDFDADGDLDLVVMGNNGITEVCRVYATGSITLHADISATALGGGTVGSVQWGDFDGDGDLDILAGSSTQTVVLQNNAGDFSTVAITLPGLGTNGQARFGDINSDGSLDILTTSGLYKVFPAQPNNAPSIPSVIGSNINGYQATLSWSASSDLETSSNALTYNLQVMPSGFFDDAIITPPGEYYSVFPGENISGLSGNAEHNLSLKINYLDTGDYQWRIQSVDASLNVSDWSALYNFTILPQPPNPPYNLQARVTNYTDIELSWTDASDDETGFRLERSTDNYTWTEIANEGNGTGDLVSNTTTYTDQGLTQNALYYYRVRATNANGQSAYSATITAATLSGNVGDPTSWAWAISGYGDALTSVHDLDIAFNDNLYVTGSFTNYITIQSQTEGSANGDDDFFFGDISLGGNLNWIGALRNPSNAEVGVQIEIDKVNMQHYILESFTNIFISSGTTYTPTMIGESDFIIYGFPDYLDVPPLFTIQITKTGYKDGIFMKMTPDGYLIVAGNTKNSISIAGNPVSVTNVNNGFMAKIDPAGNIVWAKNIFGTDGAGYLNDLNIDGNGNIYICGYFGSSMNLDGNVYTSNGSGNEVFIAKFDTNGSLVWENQSTGAGASDQMFAVTPGNITFGVDMGIYVSGIYGSSVTFNGKNLNTSGVFNSYLIKYNSDGSFQWVKPIGNQNQVNEIVIYDLATDENENVYMTGYFGGTEYIGDRTLNSNGDNDVLVAKYDSSGSNLWIKTAGGSYQERGRLIILDGNNDIYVSGTFRSSNLYFSQFSLASYFDGNDDVFMAKLNQTNLLAIPDLELKITSQTPAVVDKNYPQFRVNFKVWNYGDIVSPASTVKMIQTPDYWFDITLNDNTQAGSFYLSPINPGDSVTFSETVTLSNLEDKLRFLLYADPDNIILEMSDTNNYKLTTVDDNEPSHRVPVLQDTYLDESLPDTYFGEVANMIINENPGSAASHWGLLKFDIDYIDNTSNSIVLKVFGKTNPSNLTNVFSFDVDLYEASNSTWGSRLDPDSTLVTWNSSPSIGNRLATATFNDVDNYIEFNNDTLTEYVNGVIMNGDSLVSFYLRGKNDTGAESVQLYTQETAGNSLYTQLYMDNRPVDLKFSYANIANTTVILGLPVNLNAQLYNESNISINMATRVAVYLSSDTLLNADDRELISIDRTDWCSYCYFNINQDYTFDFSFVTGNFYVLFVADPDNKINESLESNNIRYTAVTVNPGLAPDLAVQNYSVTPNFVRPGNLVTASCDVANIGTAHLTVVTKLQLYLSSDSLFDVSDNLLREVVLSSISMSQSTSFSDTVRIPELPDGSYYFLFFADAGSVVIELNEGNNLSNRPLMINAAADAEKPVINSIIPNPGNPGPGFSNITFSVDVTDNDLLDRVDFEYNAIMTDTTSWNLSAMTNSSGSTYTVDLPESAFQNIGLRYRVSAADRAGNTAVTSAQFLYLNKSVNSESISTTTGNAIEAYRIIAIPYKLESWTVGSIFDDDFGTYDNTIWRLFRYDNPNYTELNSTSAVLSRGKGYFLISRNVSSFDVGTGTVPDETPGNEFTIPLVSGWNLIGNPYLFDVAWSDILSYNNNPAQINGQQPKKYSGSFQNANGIKAKSGVFIFSNGVMNLKIPVLQGSVSQRISGPGSEYLTNDLSQPDWDLNLKLSNGIIENNFGGIGMRSNAAEGHDQFDDYTLPRFIDYLELSHKGLKTAGASFTKKIVPTAEAYTWDFTIESGYLGKIATITWDNSYFGTGKILTLVDMDNQIHIAMGLTDRYSFNIRKINNFRILFEDPEAASGVIKSAYPNPFEDFTRFGLMLPEIQRNNVNVNVFNSLGSQVNNLFDGILPGGYHEVGWNGLDIGGHRVPPGVYIITVKINSEGIVKNISIQVVKK